MTGKHHESHTPPPNLAEEYRAVATTNPDMQPDLAVHLDRLIQQAEDKTHTEAHQAHHMPETEKTKESNALSEITSELKAIENDLLFGSNPEITLNPARLEQTVKTGDYDAAGLGRFFDGTVAMVESAQIAKDAGRIDAVPGGSSIAASTIHFAPLEKTREVYFSEDNAESLRKLLETSEDKTEIQDSLNAITKLYGYDNVLDLLEPDNPALTDPTVENILGKPEAIAAIANLVTISDTLWPEDMPEKNQEIAKRDWSDRFLKLVARLPEDIRDEYRFVSYSRMCNKIDYDKFDATRLADALTRAATNTTQLEPEAVRLLHEEARIVNFDFFTARQLQLTKDVLEGDQDAIAALKKKDVKVIFVDASGDYNGATEGVGSAFDSEDNDTLVFEINSPEDFAHHQQTLAKHGIFPSTVAIAVHGEPGLLTYGKGERAFRVTHAVWNGEKLRGPTVEQAGIIDFINNQMQESRGLTDPAEAKGRIRAIYISCSASATTLVERRALPSDNPEDVAATMKHVPKVKQAWWRKKIAPAPVLREIGSTAGVTARLAANPRLDVFGADRPIALNVHEDSGILFYSKNATGTEYTEPAGPMWKEFNPVPTTRFSVDPEGKLVQHKVIFIPINRGHSVNGNVGRKHEA